jgi:hypothetical protein
MKHLFVLLFSLVLLTVSTYGQQKKFYTHTGVEIIFSFADVEQNGTDYGTPLRFTPVINVETILNTDIGSHLGLFTGLAVRNVGYVFDDYYDFADNATYQKKFRSYNLGVPLGFKIGDLKNLFFYAGYEAEVAFLYKEKTIEAGDRIDQIAEWFSDRQDIFQHSVLVGVQFPKGANLKFKYYISDFHNQDFIDETNHKPYEGLNSNVFYFSFNIMLFKNRKPYLFE